MLLKEDTNGNLVGVLADFGSCKLLEDQYSSSSAQTSLAWAPPEYCKLGEFSDETYHRGLTAMGDMWSFGCTVLEVSNLFQKKLHWTKRVFLIGYCAHRENAPFQRP